MAFDFGKLDRAAQRAAFAHMSKTGSAKRIAQAATTKAMPVHPNLTKRYSHTETGKDGKLRSVGTISLAEAAVHMFGAKGAQERIAKYNARHAKKGPAARKVAAAKKPSAAQLKAAQDARIHMATRQSVAANKAETQRQIDIWAGRPTK